MKVASLLFCFFFIFPAVSLSQPAQPTKIDSKIGVVNGGKNEACLAIKNPRLKTGQRISVVLPHRPQSVLSGFVKQKVGKSCSSDMDVFQSASFYLLRIKSKEPSFIALGFIGTQRISLIKGIARIDLNGDRRREYFRTCTSNEGVHLTVWTGKPLIGRRIWHTYYYLPYDTEPTCTKKDHEGRRNR